MNCIACQEQLRQTLDGTAPADQTALTQHLANCADCSSFQETTRRLQSGLKLLRPPMAPHGLTARLLAAVQEDRRRLRRRTHLRFVVGLAVAASVVIAVSIYLWPKRPTTTSNPPEIVRNVPQPTPTPEVASVTPRQSVESAMTAMASLTANITNETVQETRKLIPLVEPKLPELPWEPTLPTLSLRDAGHGVSEGLEPMATHAKRAVGLLRRDMLPDF